MKSAVIFDIDGTLADNSHRMHYLLQEPQNKKKFHDPEIVMRDRAHKPVRKLLLALRQHHHILIMTARCESEKALTVNWLSSVHIRPEEHYTKLYMRSLKDTRPDDQVKLELLDQVRFEGYDPWAAVEDRCHVARMWREAGLLCLQVAENS